MRNFDYSSPTEIVFGKGVLDRVGEQAAVYGENILVVYGRGSAERTGTYKKVVDSLEKAKRNVIPFGGVVPNPRLSFVRDGIELCRGEKVSLVLAVGGGSAIDAAKAIAFGALCPDSEKMWERFFTRYEPPDSALPLGVVLTIPASGSETSDACVITNEETGQKLIASGPALRPRFAVLDPETTCSLPAFQTACGACDILAHLQERYFTAERDNDLSDRLLEAAMRHIIQNAPLALSRPGEYKWRAELMWAGTLAHSTIFDRGRNGGDWGSHMIEHGLSARYDIAHGAGLSVVFPAWMKYVYPSHKDRFVQYATRVWNIELPLEDSDVLVGAAIERYERFLVSLGLPVRLAEAGLPEIDFEDLAGSVASESFKIGGMEPLGPKDVVEILRLADTGK